jgi:very-long-chain ceramide synthase
VTLLSILFSIHFSFPHARHHTHKFFRISYYNPSTNRFALGWDDIWFVFYWIIVFTGARCFTMDYILSPFAHRAGIYKKKAKVRFAEQAWILLYYGLFWCIGMNLLINSPYWLDLRALWRDWPIREMEGLAKWYYLVQFAFWLQQIVVVNIEERRKDYWQMFSHHLVTCALIFTSYGYHQSRVGHLILVIMDPVDILLSLAKILKYLQFQLLCDIAFGVFIIVWFITRHIFYPIVCWSIYKHIPQEIKYGCYSGSDENLSGPNDVPGDWDHLTQPFRDPEGLVCWNERVTWVFLGMLLALHCLVLMWFAQIVRVAYKVLSGQPAEDTRSDDEDDEEEEEEDEKEVVVTEKGQLLNGHAEQGSFIEKEVLSTEREYVNSGTTRKASGGGGSSPGKRRSSRRRGEGHSSGVNLLAGSDRKELLGRIGCDKPSHE